MDDEWFRASEANLHGHLAALARCPCSSIVERRGLRLFNFGNASIPEFNLAYLVRGPDVQVHEALLDCEEHHRRIGRGFMLGAPGREDEILGNGWNETDPFLAMHIDLAALSREPDGAPELEARQVFDGPGMDHVTEVLCPSWGVAPREHEGVRRMMRGLSIDGQGPYRAYVLYRDGSPVSSLLIYSQAEVAGVQLVSTLPSCRGKGYAQRLLIHSLLEAKRHGAEASVLEATKMGVASYSRIGFRECGRSRYFVPPHQKASR